MPTERLGTLTSDVAGAIRSMRKGRIDFRADRDGVMHAALGKVCAQGVSDFRCVIRREVAPYPPCWSCWASKLCAYMYILVVQCVRGWVYVSGQYAYVSHSER